MTPSVSADLGVPASVSQWVARPLRMPASLEPLAAPGAASLALAWEHRDHLLG
jgi:hypothetical protein